MMVWRLGIKTDTKIDFHTRPMMVIWETTQACDLACIDCPGSPESTPSPFELSTAESERLIDSVAALHPSAFVLTGGDPMKRVDIHYLISFSVGRGLRPVLAPSATPLLTRSAIHDLKDCGLSRIALGLDGATQDTHDAFRGARFSFVRTMQAIGWANEAGLPVQINTMLSLRNMNELEGIAAVLKQLPVVQWNVFFFVPASGNAANLPSMAQFEQMFARLYRLSRELPFHVEAIEAPHYRRFVTQQRIESLRTIKGGNESGVDIDAFERGRAWPNDGKGIIFISNTGEVYPGAFLRLSVGNVRRTPLALIYRDAPLFKALRNTSMLRGKCAECEFREICGGSRARTYAMTGDPLGQEMCCIYQPAGYLPESRESEWAMIGENG
jgi:AdoMet-dependent heme synthase